MHSALLLAIIPVLSLVQYAEAQTIINVTQSPVCFLNETAGPWVWRDCGLGEDWLRATLLPFEWVTGGNFSMIIVSVFIVMSYLKYHKMIYPMMLGAFFLPISYFVFPDVFIMWALIMGFVGIGLMIAFIILKQTKEY